MQTQFYSIRNIRPSMLLARKKRKHYENSTLKKTQIVAAVFAFIIAITINAQSDRAENEIIEDSITLAKGKKSKLRDLIEFTITQIEENSSDHSAILYSNANYHGERFKLDNDWSANRHHNSWNDEVASIEVPRGQELWLYEDKNFRGEYLIITRDWSAKENPWWRNRISSVRVVYTSDREQPRNHPRHAYRNDGWRDRHHEAGVTIYEHRHFSGRSRTMYDDWSVQRSSDFWDDRISAIDIPAGYKVILYKSRDFDGRSLTLRGPRSVQLEKDSWNDEVSSIEIMHTH